MRRYLIAGVVTLVGIGGAAVPARAQAKGSAEASAAAVVNPTWKAPKLAWGHPDLEGIWTSDDMRGVPMSRPPQFGTRRHLTDEEFAARARERADGTEGRRRADRHLPQRGRHARLRLHLAGDRACGRPHAGHHGRGPNPPARLAGPADWVPSIPSTTSACGTAASRAASPDRGFRWCTATARASSRRRIRSSSPTRWCTRRASSRSTGGRTSAAASGS